MKGIYDSSQYEWLAIFFLAFLFYSPGNKKKDTQHKILLMIPFKEGLFKIISEQWKVVIDFKRVFAAHSLKQIDKNYKVFFFLLIVNALMTRPEYHLTFKMDFENIWNQL